MGGGLSRKVTPNSTDQVRRDSLKLKQSGTDPLRRHNNLYRANSTVRRDETAKRNGDTCRINSQARRHVHHRRRHRPRKFESGDQHIGCIALCSAGSLYNGLVALDKDFKPEPELADSWTIADDGKTYTFKLHPGVKWHDGKPFTSADVKFTFENLLLKFHARTQTYVAPGHSTRSKRRMISRSFFVSRPRMRRSCNNST